MEHPFSFTPSESLDRNGGVQHRFAFDNGYGASVVCGPYTYGGEDGLWELAVTIGTKLTYDTPVTSDVEGWLLPEKVDDLLRQIKALPMCVAVTS